MPHAPGGAAERFARWLAEVCAQVAAESLELVTPTNSPSNASSTSDAPGASPASLSGRR
jgi:hypothetical protein